MSIQILFKHPIHIDSITLDAKVNTQISHGFLISTAIESIEELESNIKEKNFSKFLQIAKIINDKNRQCHLYEFSRRNDRKCSSQTLPYLNVAYFSTRSSLYVDKVSGMNISITKTLNSSSACLKSIKIYGHLVEPALIVSPLKIIKANSKESQFIEIPAEFLDELTHEIMRVPILLPSKKYIDKSTLDKYFDEQKKLCNSNSDHRDPFTNVPFDNKSHKPIIDEKLKSKIDKFIFDNQGKTLQSKYDNLKDDTNQKKVEELASATTTKRKFLETLSKGLFHNELYKLEPINENYKKQKVDNTIIRNCNLCLNMKNPNLQFYVLKSCCEHVFCRNCALSSINLSKKCPICNNSFETSQVVNLERSNLGT